VTGVIGIDDALLRLAQLAAIAVARDKLQLVAVALLAAMKRGTHLKL
jgi:hypothetical protein